MLGFVKISPYIVYIQIDDKDVIRDLLKDDPNINSQLLAKRVKIIKIEHISTKDTIIVIKRTMTDKKIQTFTVNCWFDNKIYFFQTYERAFFEGFMKSHEYTLFENGYCGPCNTYYQNGQIEYEGYINNEQACGLARKYFNNGQIEREGIIINGKLNGEFKVYIKKPVYKLIIHKEYIDGVNVKDYLLQS